MCSHTLLLLSPVAQTTSLWRALWNECLSWPPISGWQQLRSNASRQEAVAGRHNFCPAMLMAARRPCMVGQQELSKPPVLQPAWCCKNKGACICQAAVLGWRVGILLVDSSSELFGWQRWLLCRSISLSQRFPLARASPLPFLKGACCHRQT